MDEPGSSEKFVNPDDGGVLIEYRANDSQTVFPPSTHVSGEKISFEANGDPAITTRGDLMKDTAELAAAILITERWNSGSRNALTLALAGLMAKSNIQQSDAERLIGAVCTVARDEERSQRIRTVADTYKKAQLGFEVKGWTGLLEIIGEKSATVVANWLNCKVKNSDLDKPKTGADLEFERTDIGNAERFVREFGNKCTFVSDIGAWATWDGARWQLGSGEGVLRMAQELVHSLRAEAISVNDCSESSRALDWAKKSGSLARIKAIPELAKPHLAKPHDTFDAHDYLLTCANTTIDLQTGEVRPPNPEDRITLKASSEFDPEAECPSFLKFLNEIFQGDDELINFIQRCVGYSLTGDNKEQCLFVLHGEGANGKSTLVNVIYELLGDYAKSTPFTTLIAKKQGNTINNDIARLRGARFVTASEGEAQDRLAEATIKRLTGGDPITARFLNKEYFDFRMKGKIWMATNHKPLVDAHDPAIWRRVMLIPFKYTVPKSQRDPQLSERLRSELPGILNWAITGCLSWQKEGLNPPASVKNATASYKLEMDHCGRFIEECLEKDMQAFTSSVDIRLAFEEWQRESDIGAVPTSKISKALKLRGYKQARTNSTRGWQCRINCSTFN